MADKLLHPESPYIGKYVCYNQADGGACWGRIKDEAVVNTMKGPKEVFILTDRYVRYWRGKNVKEFRRFYPGFNEGNMSASSPGTLDGEGKLTNDGLFLETAKVQSHGAGRSMRQGGDTTIRKEMLNLETDIIDVRDLLELVDIDTLFKAVMGGRTQAGLSGTDALDIGLKALVDGDNSIKEDAKEELKRRLESGADIPDIGEKTDD